MIAYRHATPQDLDGLCEIAIRGLVSGAIPMVIDRNKVRAMVARCINEGFGALAERNGAIVAYLGALVVEDPYFERQQLCVTGWYSEAHGAGWKLLRMLREWKRARPMIGSVLIPANPSEKLQRIMQGRGATMLPNYLFTGD